MVELYAWIMDNKKYSLCIKYINYRIHFAYFSLKFNLQCHYVMFFVFVHKIIFEDLYILCFVYWSNLYLPNKYKYSEDMYSSSPSAAYMCQWIGSALVQIMACRLFGAEPLFKPMLDYYQLDS